MNQIIRIDPDRRGKIEQYMQRHLELLKSSSLLKKQSTEHSGININDAVSCFFCEHDKMQKKAEIINRQCPDEKAKIKTICDDICNHNFDFLGTGKIAFGEKINWHRDYRACYEWPRNINYIDMGRSAFDILVGKYRDTELKFPWDVSNLMWFPSLVSAYFLTGDRQYADAVKNDLDEWLENNPPPLGVNWFCPMNIGMRAINIIVAFAAFYPHFSEDFNKRILESLMMHGIVISAYLEIGKAGNRNNHYLTNLAGLYYLGTIFRETELGSGWLDFAEKELELESTYHFYPDGTIFEDSTSYHRLSAEMLLICAVLGRGNRREFSRDFHAQLKRALNFTGDILPAHNIIPQIGDNDNGRMLQFSGFEDLPKTDHRHLLALGGEFYDDDKLRQAGRGREIEALWYCGQAKFMKKQPTAAYSFSYPDGGYYGLKSAGTHLLVHNGRISPYCGGGHAHEDQLSLTLSHDGIDILVDPGSYRYSSDQQARNEFRSVVYHNTVQINKSSMHHFDRESFEGLWWMVDQADAQTTACSFENNIFTFSGSIDSYIEKEGYQVGRRIKMDHNAKTIEIEDSALPAENTKNNGIAFSRFLFGPEIEIKRLDYRKLGLFHQDKAVADLKSMDRHTSLLLRQLWFSPEYGRRVPTWQLQICWVPAEGQTIRTRLQLI